MPYGTASIDAIDTSGNLSVTGNLISSGTSTANTFKLVTQTLGDATAGNLEYDGKVPYFTPINTQRGIVPGMQYFRLNSNLVGANVNTAQNLFGVGVTLTASTVYQFQIEYILSKTAGATSHTLAYGFDGTATFNYITRITRRTGTTTTFPWISASATGVVTQADNSATSAVMTGSIASASFVDVVSVTGTVSINAGGSFIPQYTLSAAPGGAYSTVAGSYMMIYPVGASGSNTSVGNWA